MRQIATVALVAAVGCGPGEQPESDGRSDLTIRAADGLLIAATLFQSSESQPPGLILIHMYGSNRGEWMSFASRAQKEGYSVITFDMRGHGGTAALNQEAPKFRSFSLEDWEKVSLDIDAAKRALIDAGADAERIGVVGASIGANIGANYAADHADVQALVLLSPGDVYKGVRVDRAFNDYGKRPSLLITGEGDQYSAIASRALHRSASGFCELREFPGTHHGTEIVNANPNAASQILQWCDTVLGESR
jgi:pimeloyl-ACP methyl ester carboxylesterase